MSTIKSSTEHLTINADGTGKDIKLQANGSEKVIIKSDGKVGIGTGEPEAALEINISNDDPTPVIGAGSYIPRGGHGLEIENRSDTSSYSGIFLRTRTSGASAWSINNVWSSTYLGDLTFVSRTGGSTAAEHMRISSTGNVGIGTSSPDAELHIEPSGSNASLLLSNNGRTQYWRIQNNEADDALVFNANDASERMRISSTGIDVTGVIKATSDGTAASPAIQVGDNDTGIFQPSDNVLAFSAWGTERMRIDSSGNVGIGTSSPDAKLDIESNVNGGDVKLRIANTAGSGSLDETATIAFSVGGQSPSTDWARIRTGRDETGEWTHNHSGNLQIWTASNGTVSEKVRFPSTGGITFNGDTAAANALDDYEEGTWTPDVPSGSLTVNKATYVKIGKLVHVYAYIGVMNATNDSTIMQITGLPYICESGQGYHTGNIGYSGSLVTQHWGLIIATGNTYIYFHQLSGTGSTITRSICSQGDPLLFHATYHTA